MLHWKSNVLRSLARMDVNCIIIDDEPQARRLLQTYLKHFPGWSIRGEFASALEASDALKVERIDVIFLDINMPLLKGTDFIRSLNEPPLIIFTTAYEKYALESYSLNVLDYLLKPISLERLIVSINKAESKLKGSSSHGRSPFIFVKVEGSILKIRTNEILYVEGMQNYVRLFTKSSAHIVSSTMKQMEEMFPQPHYVRIHKSYIVAVDAITKIEGNRVYCEAKELPIGGHYKTTLMQCIEVI